MAKIRVAFVGTGGIAAKHAREYKTHPDVQIVAGMDVSVAQVHSLWTRIGWEAKDFPPAFTSTAEMYKAAKPDAVVICSPHTLHFDQGMEALQHGCHVLMEKPMVTKSEHAYALKAKVEQAGKVFVIGYNTPCSGEFEYLRGVIRDKRLGRLEQVVGWLSQPWVKYVKGTWRMKPELSGGGQAYDSGAHLLNSVCWTVESNVAAVHAFVDNMGFDVDINTSMNVRFESGVTAAITINGSCNSNSGHLTYLFENGRIEIDGWGGSWINVWEGDRKIKYPPVKEGGTLTPAGNFVDAILGRDKPRTSPANGVVHSELMDAIYESARTGQTVKPRKR